MIYVIVIGVAVWKIRINIKTGVLLALDAYFIPAFKDNKLIRDDDNDEWKHDALQKYETGSYNGRDHAQISDPSKRNEWVGKLSNFRTIKRNDR